MTHAHGAPWVWLIEYHVKGRRWKACGFGGVLHQDAVAVRDRWAMQNPDRRFRVVRYQRKSGTC